MTNSSVSKRQSKSGRRALWIAVPVTFLAIIPLLWALVSSLRPGDEIFRHLSPFTLRTIVPSSISLDNYAAVLGSSFSVALFNSVFVAFFSVLIGLVVASLAAYALAVIDFPGRRLLFVVLVVSFLVPFEAIVIPLSATFRELGMQDTYAGLILPTIGNGLAIFLLRQFFMAVPTSLLEAARLDGLSWFGVFRRIYLPLSKAPLLGAGLILFIFSWQSFQWPLIIAPSDTARVAQVAIADFAKEAGGVNFGQMFAATILTSAIPLIVMLVLQRQLTGSLASSGSKE